MTRLLPVLLVLLVPSVIMLAPPALAEGPPCANANLDDVTFKIERKRHKAKPNGIRKLELARTFSRQLHFQVRFAESVRYTSADPQNQYDWNKLLGFSTSRIHKNSIRLGWAWDPTIERVRLGYYGYLDGKRTMPLLATVALGEWADVSIRFDDGGMSVSVNGIEHSERGDLGIADWLPVGTWLLRTAYFGGQEKAPHTMEVEVRGIVIDDACQR